jgi:hypothetical protein
MDTLIVNTNPLENAGNIIKNGIIIAKALDLDLELIHAIDSREQGVYTSVGDSQSYPGTLPHDQLMNKAQQESAKKIQEILVKQISLLKYARKAGSKAMKGYAEDVVAEGANDRKNCIVFLTNSESSDGVNSNDAFSIVKKVDCPVWTIPPVAQYDVPEKIMVIYHPTQKHDVLLDKVAWMAKKVNAPLLVLHPGEESDPRITLDSIKQKLDYPKVELLENIADEKNITDLSNSFSNGLLSVIDEDRSFWKKIFEKSKVKKLIKESQIPVIVYPAKYFEA